MAEKTAMAEMTVANLATMSKKSVEETLVLIHAAGLSHTKPDDKISHADIGAFLKYRRDAEAAPPEETKPATPSKQGRDSSEESDSLGDLETKRRRAVEEKQRATPESKDATRPEGKKASSAHTAAKSSAKPTHGKAKKGDASGASRDGHDRTASPAEKKRPLKSVHVSNKADLSFDPDEEIDEAVDTSKSGMVETRQILQPQVLEVGGRHQAFRRPTDKVVRTVKLSDLDPQFTIISLAQQMAVKPEALVTTLDKMGTSVDREGSVDRDTAILAVEEMGHRHVMTSRKTVKDMLVSEELGETKPRPAVVTVMGHVDHGKTSLLDFIRKTKVTAEEAGGITQHIGAYCVDTPKGRLSFIDTPGHAAFSAMRARGTNCTDVVILVVAADDGVQPQTEEAIKHAKTSGVPMVVAINKVDLEQANTEKVRQGLVALEVVPEDLGGDVQFIEISALTGKGVDALLDAVLLQSSILDLKAADEGVASGVVLESRMEKARGAIATLLVQQGALCNSNVLVAGTCCGKVRNMSDEKGVSVKKATPSMPVEVLGLDGVPDAGEKFFVVKNERVAHEVIATQERESSVTVAPTQMDADAMMQELMTGTVTHSLNVVLRADTRGTLEAISTALDGLGGERASVRILFSGVGAINESDVNLATDDTLLVGFNVRASAQVRKHAEASSVDIRYYSIIYEVLEDIGKMLQDLVPPEVREEILGVATVREVFKAPRFGKVAGCVVSEGSVQAGHPIRILRDEVVIFEGELDSLRRYKNEVSEVQEGTECGIGVKNYSDIKVGDQIEVFKRVSVPADA